MTDDARMLGEHSASTARHAERSTCLVVDDDPAVLEALGLILEDAFEVMFADDGPAALECVQTQPPDVVLLDLGLPTMSGFEVLARIKAIIPDVPVIVVTITTTTGAVVRSMKLGASDYVTKPFEDSELLGKIRAAMARTSPDGRHDMAKSSGGSHDGEPAGTPELDRRHRCLIMAGRVGTGASLSLALERYVTTQNVADGIQAIGALAPSVPDCVICDDEAWAAEGAAFIRVLRMQHPGSRTVLITDRYASTVRLPDWQTLIDVVLPQGAGLGELVRRTLALCARDSHDAVPQPSVSDCVFAAMDYLRAHYADQLSAEQIAGAAGVSRGHLAKRFSAEFGLSLSQYVVRLRVEVAKSLLGRRTAKLNEVAALAGFRDPSHLSRAFLAQTGHRPGAYRLQFCR